MEPSVSGGNDGVGVGLPDEGPGVMVVLFDVAVDGGLEVGDRVEHAAFQVAAGEFGEEALDGVEPGARGRREVEGPARVPGQPSADLLVLVGGVVVEDHVNHLAGRDVALQGIQKPDEFLMAMALHVAPDHGAVEDVEGSKKRGRPVAPIVMGQRCAASPLQGQPRLGPVERLNLRLLIDAEHHRVRPRIDIEADDIPELRREGGIGRELEVSPTVGGEAMGLPDLLHRRDREPDHLGHGAGGPMGCLVRRRREGQAHHRLDARRGNRSLARRAGLVPQQPVDAALHEALLPAPHRRLGFARCRHDAVRPDAVGGEQNDPRPPHMLLRRVPVGDDCFKAPTVAVQQADGYTPAHATSWHAGTTKDIPKGTLPLRSIH